MSDIDTLAHPDIAQSTDMEQAQEVMQSTAIVAPVSTYADKVTRKPKPTHRSAPGRKLLSDMMVSTMLSTEDIKSITASHVVGAAVAPEKLPSEIMIGDGKRMSLAEQMGVIARKHEIHETLNYAFDQKFDPIRNDTNADILLKVQQAVNDVMAEILQGSNAMRIDPREIFELVDHLRDHAFAYFNKAGQDGKPLCLETMKSQMRNHPKVRSFKNEFIPLHGVSTHANYHPETGMPSKTILASHIDIHGHCESTLGQYYDPGIELPDYDF